MYKSPTLAIGVLKRFLFYKYYNYLRLYLKEIKIKIILRMFLNNVFFKRIRNNDNYKHINYSLYNILYFSMGYKIKFI